MNDNMKKVKLNKDHVLGKKGDVLDVPAPKANYLIRCGVAEEQKIKEKKDGAKPSSSKNKS